MSYRDIILRGAPDWLAHDYADATWVAQQHAWRHPDRPPGLRHGVVYDSRFVVYWTAARSLVVRGVK